MVAVTVGAAAQAQAVEAQTVQTLAKAVVVRPRAMQAVPATPAVHAAMAIVIAVAMVIVNVMMMAIVMAMVASMTTATAVVVMERGAKSSSLMP